VDLLWIGDQAEKICDGNIPRFHKDFHKKIDYKKIFYERLPIPRREQ
jgi:hypothetical protein